MADEPVNRDAAEALRAGRWAEARDGFQASLAERESAEALAGMAEALWWLCDAPASVRYRERAFVRFSQADETALAAMTAVKLSIAYLLNLGNEAAARGWLARGDRVAQDEDRDAVGGWLALMHGYMEADRERMLALLSKALSHARRTGDIDLELVALSDLGHALVASGNPSEGMPLLDEAMAGTLAGEYRSLDTVVYTSCSMLAACSVVGDLERAAQWCRVADNFMQTYSCPFLFARCRVHYGTVLLAKGRWDQAEGELKAALKLAEDVGPGPSAEAKIRLAELRVRQGLVEEAEALLGTVDDLVGAAIPAASVRLARGEIGVAVALLERRLEQLGDADAEAAPVLAALTDAHLAGSDLASAARAAERLGQLARAHADAYTSAIAAVATAHLAVAKNEHDAAITQLELAREGFVTLDLPLETAQTRLDLARALATSRPELAVVEARTALSGFEDLGASSRADEAAALLRSLGASGRRAPRKAGVLTKREQEVLRLVGQGLSNPEIAARLFISRKTASHHVSSVLMKLGLRNRAEAVGYAARTLGP